MTTPNTEEEVLQQLMQQFPQLIIEKKLSGYVIELEQYIVHARVTLDNEEYDCEFDKHIFPQEDLAPNICFFMVLGKINNKQFTHINYFYYTQDMLETAQRQAQDLYCLLELKSKIKPGRLA